MDSIFSRRYTGTRWQLRYGTYSGITRAAVNELQRVVQEYLPYVLPVKPADAPFMDPTHLILVGTAENHPQIRELLDRQLIPAPEGPEGYTLACLDAPWPGAQRLIVIAGTDEKGALNGVVDFAAKELAYRASYDEPHTRVDVFNHLPDFTRTERPAIDHRGLWTWGYAIYDYRRFLDNMARLKMNTVTIWNDCPPVNFPEVIAYAHDRGISVIAGFHWGWGFTIDPNDVQMRKTVKEQVLRTWREEYRESGIDGVYFQTFTETSETLAGEKRIAELACAWVNEIAEGMLAESPGLSIQFGIHATAIRENLRDLAPLNSHLRITWEDAGALPYGYIPAIDERVPKEMLRYQLTGTPPPPFNPTFAETLEYAKACVTLRPRREFYMVAKGFSCIRWNTEFENHEGFVLGERSAVSIRRRLDERSGMWDDHNRLWMRYAPEAAAFYRDILALAPEETLVTALVEDGMFEEKIQPSIAILAEILWNPHTDTGAIIEQALGAYYR